MLLIHSLVTKNSDLLEDLHLQAVLNEPAALFLWSHLLLCNKATAFSQQALSAVSVNLWPLSRWRMHLGVLQTGIYSLLCICPPLSSLVVSTKVTERLSWRVSVLNCAFLKPDWLNTFSLSVTRKVCPLFMPRVRFEVCAVWNGSWFHQHEAINELCVATEPLRASISPWIRIKSFKI